MTTRTIKNDEKRGLRNGRSPEEFVNILLNEASQVPCDETLENFDRTNLPEFFDRRKFTRAQEFFREHIFALYFNKLLGLIVTLASPSVLKILQLTNLSGCVLSSYRRYMATLLHMNIWYEEKLSVNSRSMKSIQKVKCMHNMASKKARSLGMPYITQKDMVLTQFGFMGFAIARTESVGVHNATKDDLECLIHFWKVIGYLMGIEDKYNICRETLEETSEICEILIQKVLLPSFETKDKDFLRMTSYLVDGMWNMNPILNYRVFLSYLYEIMRSDVNKNNNETESKHLYFDLNFGEKCYLRFVHFVLYILKFNPIRIYLNFQKIITLWIMDHFPFLAIFAFGYNNAFVRVE